MLVIEFKKGQGLGNQLWNYVVLRSISDLNNFKFKILNFNDFKGKNFLHLEKENTNEPFDERLFNFYKGIETIPYFYQYFSEIMEK